jgi:hypothetical protein
MPAARSRKLLAWHATSRPVNLPFPLGARRSRDRIGRSPQASGSQAAGSPRRPTRYPTRGVTLHPRVPDACDGAAGDHVRSARVPRHRSSRASAGPRWSGPASSKLTAQDAPEEDRGKRPHAGELRRRGKFVPDALQQARRAEPQFLHPGTPADSTRHGRVGAVREGRPSRTRPLISCAGAPRPRAFPHAFASLPLGLRNRGFRTRVRAAASSEKKKAVVAARTNSPARGLLLRALRASA